MKAASPSRATAAPLTASAGMAEVAPSLLAWYDRHRRVLPWRSPPGQSGDPYAIWLSEIMLQQTTVAAVTPYFAAFLARWPTVESLAGASLDDVLRAWAGLGYYSRARNLHGCARTVVTAHGGRFPDTEDGLRTLPGVGPYTAAAIAAIAFGRRAVVVDGNVERVMARLFAVETPLPGARPLLRAAMDQVTPAERTGDFAQAVMDLGATVCTPRRPACVVCPLATPCHARRMALTDELPRRAAKAAVPRRGGAIALISRPDGSLLVRQRALNGLFGGMTEFPTTPWREDFEPSAPVAWEQDLLSATGPLQHIGRIEHGLTHFTLTLEVYRGAWRGSDDAAYRWATPERLLNEALPTLMRKVLDLWLRREVAPSEAEPSLLSPRLPPSPEPDASRTRRRPRTGRHRTGP